MFICLICLYVSMLYRIERQERDNGGGKYKGGEFGKFRRLGKIRRRRRGAKWVIEQLHG